MRILDGFWDFTVASDRTGKYGWMIESIFKCDSLENASNEA